MDFWFFVKKLISAFSMPLTIAVLLLAIAIFMLWFDKSRNAGKWMATIGIIFLYLISFAPFSNLLLAPIEQSYPYYQYSEDKSSAEKVGFIVVLGHISKDDPNLPLSSRLSPETINRLVEGISIYRQHKGSKLIFSGVNSEEYGSHPERVKQMSIALGVPEADIIVVNGPKDTHDEARAIKSIVNTEKFALVTSASHMQRAMALFLGQGLNPVAAPTYFRVKAGKSIGFFPSPFAIEKTQFAVYEYLGYLWSKLAGQQGEKGITH